MTLSLLAVCQRAKKLAEEDGRDWFAMTADAMERYMAVAAEQMGEPTPSTERDTPW